MLESIPLPTTIGRFRVEARLGAGGMGEVYRAYDETLCRTIAVKTVRPDINNPSYLERLYREAQAVARLQHPNIVTVFEAGEMDGQVYIAMEFLKGETLAAALGRGDLRFETKIGIVMQILEALQYAHGEGVIHRDIKPANVHRMPDGSIKILDFGIARIVRAEALTQTGAVIGTPYYSSPEQLNGEAIDPRTDIYSAGVLAYELLTGRRPFDGDSLSTVMMKVLLEPPPPMGIFWANTFPEIERIVTRALAKSAGDRYATAEDMYNALAAFLSTAREALAGAQAQQDIEAQRAVIQATTCIANGGPGETQADPPPLLRPGAAPNAGVRDTPGSPRRKIMWVAAAAAVIVVGIGGWMLTNRDPSSGGTRDGRVASGGTVPGAETVAVGPDAGGSGPAAGDPPPAGGVRTAGGGGGATGAGRATPATGRVATPLPAGGVSGRGTPATGSGEKTGASRGRAAPVAPAAPVGNTAAAAPSAAIPGAKQLFIENGSSNLGLRYAIVRQTGSGVEDVHPETTFHTGDKIRFSFESNTDGYLYVISEGSSGKWNILFPSPQINGGTNAVRKGQKYTIPSQGWFAFSDPPGAERAFVFLSREPLASMPGFKQPVTGNEEVGRSAVDDLKGTIKSRDLVFEKEQPADSGAAGPKSMFVANRDELGKAVSTTIQLVHD